MPNNDFYSALVCLETQVDLLTRTMLCMVNRDSEMGRLLSLVEDKSSLKVMSKDAIRNELMTTKRKFYEQQHTLNTSAEKRQHSYQREADPIREQALSYQTEAAAWRLGGDSASAAAAEAKAAEAMLAYLEKKKEIRLRFPDDDSEGA